MVLQRYFAMSGDGTELVLPKQLELQEKLRQGPPKDLDFFPEELDGEWWLLVQVEIFKTFIYYSKRSFTLLFIDML